MSEHTVPAPRWHPRHGRSVHTRLEVGPALPLMLTASHDGHAPHRSAKIAVTAKKFRQSVTKSARGKSAKTTAVVGARGTLQLAPYRGRDATLVWLMPHTGRRHQLRLHMAHIGFPIVGDFTYANDRLCHRMFLHASALELPLRGLAFDSSPDDGNGVTLVRAMAPLTPHGWVESFTPSEPIRSPEGWPDAAAVLASGLGEAVTLHRVD